MASTFTALSFIASALIAGHLFAQEDSPAEQRSRTAERRSRAAEARAMELRFDLGLDEQHSFKARAHHTDDLGQCHTRLDQYFKGVRVWGGQVIDHANVDESRSHETVRPMTRSIFDKLSLRVEPALGVSEALGIVHGERNIRAPYSVEPTVELVVYPEIVDVTRPGVRAGTRLNAEDLMQKVKKHVLAYHVHTETESHELTDHVDYLIDAHTGAILKTWSTLHTDAAKGQGHSQFSGTVTLDTHFTGNTYELRDLTRGTGGTFGNNVVTDLKHASEGTGAVYTDLDNAWGDGNNYTDNNAPTSGPNGQTAAVDAAYGIQVSWDMFLNVFGRNGIDGNGTATYARVHYLTLYNNAFWADTCFCMSFGDGYSFKSLEALDIVAHELSHGVCAKSAGLIYSGESGGLNEANSDIFGTLAEFYRAGGATGNSLPSTGGNWTIGEQLQTPKFNRPMRYMHKPSLDGKSPDAWSSSIGSLNVHYSSGPMNRCFYFLSQGATPTGLTSTTYLPSGMTGVGNDKAGRIWYRALTAYLTSSSNYVAARTACISAAQDLYGSGSAEEAAVWNAFAGINVGKAWTGPIPDPNPDPDPEPTPTSVSLLKNGDFELGATGWSGTTGAIAIWAGQPAYAGTKNAWLGGNGRTATETLSQIVTIPTTATGSLSFCLHIDTAENSTTTAYDQLSIQVFSSTGTLLKTLATYSNLTPCSGYAQRVLDMSTYRGQTVKVQFKMAEDISAQTTFALDNVVLK